LLMCVCMRLFVLSVCICLSSPSVQSMDQRPEIRNCATNTLFAAIVANGSMLSVAQWVSAWADVIFPLLEMIAARCQEAGRSKELAKTPELKKGVKMTMHHSRDTARKQWCETSVLALRGLSRVVRTCTRLLLAEPWFADTWATALAVCVRPVVAAAGDLEVSLAAADTLFEMLKMVSARMYKSKNRAGKGMRMVGGSLAADDGKTLAVSTTASPLGPPDGAADGPAAMAAMAATEVAR
jgi:hypothetical protein